MNGTKLIDAMNHLPDEMIAEAIHARKRAFALRKKWLLPVACLCVLLFAVIGFNSSASSLPGNIIPPQQNEPPAYQLSEEELHSSVYASYCPDYAELGCEVYQAEIVCETTFHAIFTTPTSDIVITTYPLQSKSHYLYRLVDVALTEDSDKQQYRSPVFHAHQFTAECLDYVKVNRTADGGYIAIFNVIDNDFFISYGVDSDSLEWINRAFESIARCYQ